MLRILKHLKAKELFMACGVLVFVVTQVFLELRMPEYMNEITVRVQTGGAVAYVWRAGGWMLLCALGGVCCAVVTSFLASRLSASFSLRLRSMLFHKVESFSMEEINRFSTASLITRSTGDVTQVQMIVAVGLTLILRAPIMAIWAVTKIMGKGYEWSLATATAVGMMLCMFVVALIFLVPKFRRMQALIDNVTAVTRENLTGLRVVRAYNAEGYQAGKFDIANQELTGTQLFTTRYMAVMNPFMNVVIGGLHIAVYWIGAVLIQQAVMGAARFELFGSMVVFSMYAMQVVMSFMMLIMLFFMLPRASVSAGRIHEVLETELSIREGTETGGDPRQAGCIEFRNVSFKYPGAADYMLKDISFTVRQGETAAIIGSTGSGKSTLLHLVPRFYDATEGEVWVSGANIRDYTFEALYNKLGYVPQKAVLFRGSVAENTNFGDSGREAAEDDVKTAIRIAQADEFVGKLEEGYDAPIAQGGSNLSGGQRQRLAIARAICRRPEIYLFDDTFSALDYRTDRDLRAALKKETAGVTSIIVAQRVGTILNADKIIVLDEGVKVGEGTHKELLKSCPVYYEIAASQLTEEELAL
jgi:ATP-binding cassette subfamily B protein